MSSFNGHSCGLVLIGWVHPDTPLQGHDCMLIILGRYIVMMCYQSCAIINHTTGLIGLLLR